VLRQLEADDWIQRDGKYWRPDIKSGMLDDDRDEDKNRDGFSLDAEELLDE